jgi:hypothetical protein
VLPHSAAQDQQLGLVPIALRNLLGTRPSAQIDRLRHRQDVGHEKRLLDGGRRIIQMVCGHQMPAMVRGRASGGRREGFGVGGLTRIGHVRIEPEIVCPGSVAGIVAGVVAELEGCMFLAIQLDREACVVHSAFGIGGQEA